MRLKKILTRIVLLLASIIILLLAYLGYVLHQNYQLFQCEQPQADLPPIQQEIQEPTNEKPQSSSATIMCVGDFVMHQAILESGYYQQNQQFDFNEIFKYIKTVYEEADLCFATIEGAFSEGNYSGYPIFLTPSQLIDDLKENGIDLLNMASNHVYDQQDQGMLHSMEVLEAKGMDYQGIRKSGEDKNYYVKEINGIKVGFFNYVYETIDPYGNVGINGILLSEDAKIRLNSFALYDLDALYHEVDEILANMKAEDVEFIVANMHWGDEYQHVPNLIQQSIAQVFCDKGIDALIGSHPHVVQSVDCLSSSDGTHQMLCAYSLGNHLSNQRVEYMGGLSNGNTEDGLMVKLSLLKNEDGEVLLEDVEWIPTWVYYEYDPMKASYYQIMPLDRYIDIAEAKGVDFSEDAISSLARSEAIIKAGKDKISQLLPLK